MNSHQNYQKARPTTINPMNPPSRFPASNSFKPITTPIYSQSQSKPSNYFITEEKISKPAQNDDDDDLLDISDTELIRASQVVESQLRFTNNVHHTTNNAMNIFSQFNNNDCGGNVKLMGGANASMYNTDMISSQLDDVKCELKQAKTENMQKDGEVRILRDKIKRLEQELQRSRTEKVDMSKKLQQQQDEAKKNLQKQIEFKELENQFKSQEIVELTMKYKMLESNVKKTPLSSTPATSNSMMSTPVIVPSKTGPTKRLAQTPMSHFDIENENPMHENKRPNLQANPTPNGHAMKPPPAPNRIPLSPFNNAKPKTPLPQNTVVSNHSA